LAQSFFVVLYKAIIDSTLHLPSSSKMTGCLSTSTGVVAYGAITREPSSPRGARLQSRLLVCLCWAAAALGITWCCSSRSAAAFSSSQATINGLTGQRNEMLRGRTVRGSSVVGSIDNQVKTVAETIAEFYKGYPSPPVLPMYRTFIVDLMTQTHLTVVDSRFKYDAIFGLGLKASYTGLMSSYDKQVGGSAESEKIWKAMVEALGLDVEAVDKDAAAMETYASSTSPADILLHMEGSGDSAAAEAFSNIRSGLYSGNFGIGMFQVMEHSKAELNNANVEEWAKVLNILPSKMTSDLETYKLNKKKLQAAEDMIREVEIREKKKLAERLEAKAKALAEKSAAKTPEAEAKSE